MKLISAQKQTSEIEIAKNIAYLSGAIHDGCLVKRKTVQRYDLQFYQKNKSWLENSILQRLSRLGIETPIRGPYKNSYYLKFGNKWLYKTLEGLIDTVPQEPELKFLFIRGFWDAEGSCPHVEKYLNGERKRKKIPPQVGFHQNGTSELLEQIRKALINEGIKCSKIDGPLKRPVNKKPEYRFFIYSSGRIKQFLDLIKPEHSEKNMRLNLLVENVGRADRKL